MHKNLAKAGKLPKEYETIYNKAKAVVYMSFGSNAQSQYMPEVFKKALIGGFREFPEIEVSIRLDFVSFWEWKDSKKNLIRVQ